MDGKIDDLFNGTIQLAQEVCDAVDKADLFRQDCEELGMKVDKLVKGLRSVVAANSSQGEEGKGATCVYDRPTRHVLREAQATLEKAMAILRRCKRDGPCITRQTNVVPTSEFRKVGGLLEGSIGDVTWLLTVNLHGHYGRRGRMEGLPPIASTDPMLAWIWGQVAIILTGSPAEREDAAEYLASIATENDRNRTLIMEEGGARALLKLLKHGSTVSCRIASANALGALAANQYCVEKLLTQRLVPVFIHVLDNGPMKVQAKVAWAIAKIAAQAPDAETALPIESFIRPLLLQLLILDQDIDGDGHNGLRAGMVGHQINGARNPLKSLSISEGKTGWNRIIDLSRSMNGLGSDDNWETKSTYSTYSERCFSRPWDSAENLSSISLKQSRHSRHSSDMLPRHSRNRSDSLFRVVSSRSLVKDREPEDPETQREFKTQATFALWKLAENSVRHTRKMVSARALPCFARLIEKEKEDILRNTIMAVMEMAAAAEGDVELRRMAFRPNSTSAKALLDQLLRVVQNGRVDLQVPSLKAIGCLSRTFPAKETKAVIGLLVGRLSHTDLTIAAEAVLALLKFAQRDNFLHIEHSKIIVDAEAVPLLVQLILDGHEEEEVQVPALVLLCNLAIDAGNNDSFRTTNAIKVFKAASRSGIANIQSVSEVLPMAIRQLEVHH